MGSKKGRQVREVPRILVIADAVASTGFARVNHSIMDRLYKKYDVHVLGVNYFGDPHNYPYKVYPAAPGGDVFGLGRLPQLLKGIRPHLVFMINDPWLVKDYIEIILKTPLGTVEGGKQAFPHTVAYMPVDGLNMQPGYVKPLNALNLAVGYTQFAVDELRKGGLTAHTAIVPHGVDTSIFKPVPKDKAREAFKLPNDWFIVGCVNRNQPRKRIDLAMQYFAEWAKDKPENVKLYYHGALRDHGWGIEQLADFFGIQDRLILTSNDMTVGTGIPVEALRNVYSVFDVHMSTTIGEGWGLTQHESMACRVPNIVPEWSALAEWARGGVAYVPCTSIQVNTGGLNTVGGVADKHAYMQELDKMYYDATYRNTVAKAGYDLVLQPRFSWNSVANTFDTVFTDTLKGRYVNHNFDSKRSDEV